MCTPRIYPCEVRWDFVNGRCYATLIRPSSRRLRLVSQFSRAHGSPRPPAPSPRQPPIRVRLCGATSRSWMVLVIWSLLTAILVGARWDLAAVWSAFPWWPVILGIFPGAYWSFINIWWSVELFCPFFFLSCFSSYWFFFFGIYVIYFLFSNYSWIRYSFVLVVGV